MKLTRSRLAVRLSVGAMVAVIAAALSGCMIPIPTVQPLTTIEPVDEVKTVDAGGAQRAVVRLRLLSRTLTIRGADDVSLLRGRFRYNVKEWTPNIKQEVDGDTARVTINQGVGSQIPIGQHDEFQNAWDIDLVRGLPLDLGVDMGAGQATLDLTGISLENLSVTSGSTDLSLTFGAPNPQPLGSLRLTAGAGKVAASGLGNANFDQFSVLGGAGTLDLDFSGAFQRSALADVKAGAGRITIRVPASIGVRATLAGTPLSGIDTLGFTEQGDEKVYVNDAYGNALLTLTVKITTGLGSISLISQ